MQADAIAAARPGHGHAVGVLVQLPGAGVALWRTPSAAEALARPSRALLVAGGSRESTARWRRRRDRAARLRRQAGGQAGGRVDGVEAADPVTRTTSHRPGPAAVSERKADARRRPGGGGRVGPGRVPAGRGQRRRRCSVPLHASRFEVADWRGIFRTWHKVHNVNMPPRLVPPHSHAQRPGRSCRA